MIPLLFSAAKECMMAGGRALDLNADAAKIRAEAYRFVEAACETHMTTNGGKIAAARRMLIIIAKICIMSDIEPCDLHPTGTYAPDRVYAPITFLALGTGRLGLNNDSYKAYVVTATEATIDIAVKMMGGIDRLKQELE